MKIVKINKIQYFIIISLIFHTILFILWLSFASLKKDIENIEIFLINEKISAKEIPSNIKKSERIMNKKIPEIKKLKKNDIYKEENITDTDSISIKAENTSIKATEVTKGLDIYTNANFQGSDWEVLDTSFGNMNGPRFVYRETPTYPQIARKLGKEGRVVLRLTINEKGELLNIEIVESAPYGFTESAVEAIRKSKFLPATKDGRPVASRAILPIKFVLKN